jgi:hypothetical protein
VHVFLAHSAGAGVVTKLILLLDVHHHSSVLCCNSLRSTLLNNLKFLFIAVKVLVIFAAALIWFYFGNFFELLTHLFYLVNTK